MKATLRFVIAEFIINIAMSNNFIRAIPDLSNLTRLEVLSLDGNRIHEVHEVKVLTLRFLSLNKNKLKFLKISTPSIKELFFKDNRAQNVGQFLQGDISSIQKIYYSHNLITSSSQFPHMKSLVHMDFAHCSLRGAFVLNISFDLSFSRLLGIAIP